MTYSLIPMAQQVGRSDRLLGSLIYAYGERTDRSWTDIASELSINPEQLARLALCSRPASGRETAQIATHVGMDRRQLASFIRRAERERAAVSEDDGAGHGGPSAEARFRAR